MKLNTMQVDWGALAEHVDLTCRTCGGTGKAKWASWVFECDECSAHVIEDHQELVIPADSDFEDHDAPAPCGDPCPECGCTEFTVYDLEEEHEEVCNECEDGYLVPMYNTIWNTGFHARDEHELPRSLANVIAFELNGEIWFALSCCGMDCTPFLAKAWLEMFPGCRWLPDNFLVTGVNLRMGYIPSCVGDEWAEKIYAATEATCQAMQEEAKRILGDLHHAQKCLLPPEETQYVLVEGDAPPLPSAGDLCYHRRKKLFRLLDADGKVRYMGYFVAGTDGKSKATPLAPHLKDGCVAIQYLEPSGVWSGLLFDRDQIEREARRLDSAKDPAQEV